MGDPHEIQYTLTFDRSTVRAMKKTAGTGFWMAAGAAFLAAGASGWFLDKKKEEGGMKRSWKVGIKKQAVILGIWRRRERF